MNLPLVALTALLLLTSPVLAADCKTSGSPSIAIDCSGNTVRVTVQPSFGLRYSTKVITLHGGGKTGCSLGREGSFVPSGSCTVQRQAKNQLGYVSLQAQRGGRTVGLLAKFRH